MAARPGQRGDRLRIVRAVGSSVVLGLVALAAVAGGPAAAAVVAPAPAARAAAEVGAGYWLVASDGGVFSFGDAAFHGSMGAKRLDSPVVGMAATPDGAGYWLVASDGGVFSFGDAAFYGSLPGAGTTRTGVVGASPSADGKGYAVADDTGTVWSFGDAARVTSLPGLGASLHDVAGLAPAPGGAGFWLAGADGGVFGLGGAPYSGSLPALGVHVHDVVDIAAAVVAGAPPPTAPSGGSGGSGGPGGGNPPPPPPTWSGPVTFDAAAVGASEVSCASPSFCVAVDGAPGVWSWNGSVWTPSPTLASGTVLDAVSCATTTSCLAVGSSSAAGQLQTFAAAYDGSSWSAAPGFAPVPTVGGLLGVSCPTASFCVAVGDGVSAGGADGALAETLTGATWSTAFPPVPASPPAAPPDYALHTVSCPGTTFCAAAGQFTSGPNGESFVDVATGSTWTLAPTPGLAAGAELSSVSCATASSCVAVGESVVPHGPPPAAVAETFDGSGWTADARPPATPLWSVACAATTCAAGGVADGDVLELGGTAWSPPQDVDGTASITGLSLLGGGFAMATDNMGRSFTATVTPAPAPAS